MFTQLKALARAQAENAELRRKLAIAQYAAEQAEQAKKQLENYQSFYKSHVEMHTKLLNEERDRRIQAEKDALEATEKLKRQEHENGQLREQLERQSCPSDCKHKTNPNACRPCSRYPFAKDKYIPVTE